MTSRIILPALAAVLAASAVPVVADSLRINPHDPALACAAIGDLVADINADDPTGIKRRESRTFYTDDLGKVEPGELPALNAALRPAAGDGDKPRASMAVVGVWPISEPSDHPLYVVTLTRDPDHQKGVMTMASEMEEYQTTWLIQFNSNTIETVRQASEVIMLTDSDKALKGCGDM